MNPLRNRFAASMLLCVVIDATTTGQQPGVRVNPIPAVERFVQGTGLRVRLTVAKSSLAAFEDPGFVVRLDNVGSAPVRVNPNVESNLYIYDEHGRFVPRQSAEERDQLVRAGGVRPRLRCLTHVVVGATHASPYVVGGDACVALT